MQDVCGHDVHGIPPQAPRRADGSDGARQLASRIPGYVIPALAAVMLAVLLFHLLVAMAAHIRSDDPAGVMSSLFGMGIVLLVFLPFAAQLAARARLAWSRADA